MNDDFRDDRNDEIDQSSGETTFRLSEDSFEEENSSYRRRREYDNGYYENRYDRYKNEYNIENKKEKKSKGRGGTIIFALVFSLIGSLLGGAFGAKLAYDKYRIDYSTVASTPPSYTINAKDEVTTVSAVAASNLDSVVGITTTTIMRDVFNRQYGAQAMGSGFVVDERGYIMTNDHVIASLNPNSGYSSGGHADEVAVVLNDGTQLPAKVLWSDSAMDLAMLKVEPERPLKAVKLGNSDELVIGEQAIAIGNPFALEFHGTVTAGYISGLNRTVSGQGTEMQNLIQTDASINRGNSGGPLLNGKGEVIGINTLKISSGEGLGFSIPINSAKPVIEQVVETGTFERVTIGVKGVDLEVYEKQFNIDLVPESGIIVAEVFPNSPAAKVGLQPNDVITKIDGEEIESFKTLQTKMTKYSFGDTATIEYYRNGTANTADITFQPYNQETSF